MGFLTDSAGYSLQRAAAASGEWRVLSGKWLTSDNLPLMISSSRTLTSAAVLNNVLHNTWFLLDVQERRNTVVSRPPHIVYLSCKKLCFSFFILYIYANIFFSSQGIFSLGDGIIFPFSKRF